MLQSSEIFEQIKKACDFSTAIELGKQDLVLAKLKNALKIVEDFHLHGGAGTIVCQANCYVIDSLLTSIFNSFQKRRNKLHTEASKKFCVLALGGYGRCEMSPSSDVDIMLLFSRAVSKQLKASIVDMFLYPLWNLGLKIGHVSLTSTEAIDNAFKDPIFLNAIFDVRFLCGSQSLYSRFSSKFKLRLFMHKRTHFEHLMRLKRDRHEKFGWTPYLQEPNIKNGIGGLRDFHTMRWKTKMNFGGDIRELAKRKIISSTEYLQVMRAFEFLLRVRNHLHYISTFPTDTVDAEYQPKLADFFCRECNVSERIELFMRKLYFAFRTVDFVSKSARKRMRLKLPDDVRNNMRNIGSRFSRNKKIHFDEFSVWRGEVSAHSSTVFKRRPEMLMDIFRKCQDFDGAPSESLELLIRDNLYLADDSWRNSPKVYLSFLDILKNKGKVFSALEVMHYWGVLGAFLPEFNDITCMVQQEYYHRYTADVHTLNSIAILDKIFCAGADDGVYWRYHKALMSLAEPEIIYLMLLLHDIGKGDGIKSHAQVSADTASYILNRWNLPQSEIDAVVFAVKNHLEMARFWQRNDVDDDDAIRRFARLVGNETNLKYLYILTFCDANATNDTFWNSYKQSLHEMLYTNTLQCLSDENGESFEIMHKRSSMIVAEILESDKIVGLENVLTKHLELLPQNYIFSHGKADVIRHVKLVDEFLKNQILGIDVPAIEWGDHPRRSISSLCVVSRDRSGLFLNLVGILTLMGFDILGSKILTRTDGITIDTFFLASADGGIAKNPQLREYFKKYFSMYQKGSLSVENEVEKIWAKTSQKAKGDIIKSVKVFRRSKNIVVEILAFDCRGILFKIAKKIRERGYEIVFARVNTEHSFGRNTFYIRKPKP